MTNYYVLAAWYCGQKTEKHGPFNTSLLRDFFAVTLKAQDALDESFEIFRLDVDNDKIKFMEYNDNYDSLFQKLKASLNLHSEKIENVKKIIKDCQPSDCRDGEIG